MRRTPEQRQFIRDAVARVRAAGIEERNRRAAGKLGASREWDASMRMDSTPIHNLRPRNAKRA